MSRRDKRRRRAKKKARLEEEVSTSAGDPHGSSHDASLEARVEQQEPVPQDVIVGSGVDEDSPPRFDRLGPLSMSSEPTPEGAWWITAQTAQHVVELATLRDRRTGETLPRPLREVLIAVADTVATGIRPRPADDLHRAAVLCHDAIRRIIASPKSHLVRHHEQRPVYALRELDGRCMMWMARQPGRNIREKLGGKKHALGVVRRFSLDTHENRVLRRLIDTLMRRIRPQIDAKNAFDERGPCDDEQQAVFAMCRRALESDLAGVRVSEDPRPNNVLLGDADYSRIWRAWQIFGKAEEHLPARWKQVTESFASALFWSIAASLHAVPGARICERLVTLGDETELQVVDVLIAKAKGQATLVRVSQSGSSVRVVASCLGEADSLLGRVKFARTEGDKRFGFIQATDGQDDYFDPSSAGGVFDKLEPGVWVTFHRRMKGGREAAFDLVIVDSPGGLAAAPIRQLSDCEWTVQSQRGFPLLANRGTPVTLRSEPNGASMVATGDLEGLRQLRDVVLREAKLRYSQRVPDTKPKVQFRHLGIDATGWNIRVSGPPSSAVDVLPYLNFRREEQHAAPQPGPVGRTNRLLHVDADHSVCSLAPIFEGAADSRSATAGRQVFRALAAELGGHVEHIAHVVPDHLDEFSQQTLRTSVASGYIGSLPVARSVAAALAWQENAFDGATVKDGDVVLVLANNVSQLSATVLVARTHGGLREAFPETHGVYWERRPAIAIEEYVERLGGRDLWIEYARQLVGASDSGLQDRVANYLVDAGVIQEVAKTGVSQWLRVEEQWFVVEHDHRLWAQVVQEWHDDFANAFDAGLSRVLVDGLPPAERSHLLLVGRPFDERSVRSFVESDRFTSTAFLPEEDGALATGAAAFSRRSSEGFPVWHDWLPDLFLEVVRDGLFDEIELMRDVRVSASLGAEHIVDVAETLVLPGSETSYQFSLVAGRANRRPIPVDIQLGSTSFPLAEDTPVRLRLTYRYGVDNGYDLSVIATEPSARFSELKGTWVSSGGAVVEDSLVPQLQTAAAPLAEWLKNEADVAESLDLANRRFQMLRQSADPPTFHRQLRWLRFRLLEFVGNDLGNFVEGAAPTFIELLREIVEGAELPGIDAYQLWRNALDLLCAVDPKNPTAVELVERRLRDHERLLSTEPWLCDVISTLHRRDPEAGWMDRLWDNVLNGIKAHENPKLFGGAIRALGQAVWLVDGFLLDFADRHSDFVPRVLYFIEAGVRSTVERAVRALEPDSEVELFGGHLQGLQANCELLLGLLALRGTQHGNELEVGSPRMLRLAKTIRRADCLVTKAGQELRSDLGLEVPREEKVGLEKVSDLVFVLNRYLTGSAGVGTIRISSFTDE